MKEQITEIEAIKRIEECRNTPDFQPYHYVNQALDMAIQSLEMQNKLKEWIEKFKRRDDFIVGKTELLSLLNEFVVKEPKIDLGVLNEDQAKVK